MVLKIPPPPRFSGPEWAAFNRWLLELQSILSNTGNIDPTTVQGLPATQAQVTQNTSDIASLQSTTGGQTIQISSLQTQVTGNTNSIATINGQITTLTNRNQVFNGTAAPVTLHANGDYFVDTINKHLYVQVAGAWILII